VQCALCTHFGFSLSNRQHQSHCTEVAYSHLSNKRGGGAKFAKSLNVEVGINVEGGILWKKLMHNSNKQGVEGGKNLRNQ
jgi:hypothetical protein